MNQTRKPIVLVVEDDVLTAQRIRTGLEINNFVVIPTASLMEARDVLKTRRPDLVVLDISLPDGLGYSMIESMREAEMGILCISAAGELDDRVNALTLGADDYLVKPIATTELALKLNNLYQRIQQPKEASERACLSFSHYICDPLAQRVTKGNTQIDLTPGEFQLLHHFLKHPRTTLGRERLIQMLSSQDKDVSDRSIDIMVYKLRQKLEVEPKAPLLLKSVYGVGYIFDCEVSVQYG